MFNTKFRTGSIEDIYIIKKSISDKGDRYKDKVDLKTWEDWKIIDEEKLNKINEAKKKYRILIDHEKIS